MMKTSVCAPYMSGGLYIYIYIYIYTSYDIHLLYTFVKG